MGGGGGYLCVCMCSCLIFTKYEVSPQIFPVSAKYNHAKESIDCRNQCIVGSLKKGENFVFCLVDYAHLKSFNVALNKS